MRTNIFLIISVISLLALSSCARRPVQYGADPYYYPQGLYYANQFYDPRFYSFIPRGNRIIIVDRRTERQVAAPRRGYVRPAPDTDVGRQPSPDTRQRRTPREDSVEPRRREQPAPSPRRGETVTPPQQRREQPRTAPAPRSRETQPRTRTEPAQRQPRSTPDSGTGGSRSRRGGN